ncbi:MAG TPA: phosphoglucosamine mutase [Thermoanaerobaculia bacterium]|nr:phosphoglucosamine mutase [Thermoanaerobaculia bacterium]
MRSLFGTDGIRGVAGTPPLDDATVSCVGAALAGTLTAEGFPPPVRIALGCDTRESSLAISSALAGGVVAAGGTVFFAGVLPTPGVAYVVQALEAAAGLVVSASHNPWQDNGVKVFSSLGKKLPDEVEVELEKAIESQVAAPPVPLTPDPQLVRYYVEHLVSTLPHRLDGLKVVVDAAHGAAFDVAPRAFREAGAEVVALNTAPNGRNINDGCGALHPEGMARAVVTHGADLGLALDGDADRIVAADAEGKLLDGDDLLFLWVLELMREGRKPATVVGTVMSNWGLETALAERGIRLVRAPVGDRYVVEAMERERAPLGGEPSGHLIRSDLTTTGDGILTGLHLAALVVGSKQPLAAQPRIVHTPQVLKNVKVRTKVPFEEIPGFEGEKKIAEERLAGHGRLLLRYSGTEALARVMVEGNDAGLVESVAGTLAEAIQRSIGV